MAKKGKVGGVFDEGISKFTKLITSRLLSQTFEDIKEQIMITQKKIMNNFFGSLLVGLGFLVLIYAFYNYLVETLLLTRSQITLFVGLLLLAIGFFLKYNASRK